MFIFNVLKNYMNFIMIYHFYLRGRKLCKTEYVTHTRNLKQALKHRLFLLSRNRIMV